ncbi:MAG TPA: hypothetical protein VHA13_03840 [Gammaproteobacteria bacterium]|nr:hypothetical protein [Gammaproteobacteria bacterium]
MKNTLKSKNNNAWEARSLGASEKHVRRASPEREKKLDNNLGLQSISIRLPKSLLTELKNLAFRDGLGYQPYVRQILMRHVQNENNKHHTAKR